MKQVNIYNTIEMKTVDIEVREAEIKLLVEPLRGLTVVVDMTTTVMMTLVVVDLLVTIPGTPLEHLLQQRHRPHIGNLLKDRGRKIGKEMIMGGILDLNMEVAGIVFNAVRQ